MSASIGHISIDNKIAGFGGRNVLKFGETSSPRVWDSVLTTIRMYALYIIHTFMISFHLFFQLMLGVQALKNGRNVVDFTESVDSKLAVINSKFSNDKGNESESEVLNQQD